MYKIYINETPLFLSKAEEVKEQATKDDKNLLARYPGKPKYLFNYIDMLEKSKRFESVRLFYEDYEKLKTDFEDQFEIVEAAGGIVFNEHQEILFIFRRGSWDLPKGKIDPGETIKEAAIREVQEEVGLKTVTIDSQLDITHHTYKDSGKKRILKRTYWFVMRTTETELTPQAEEDIEIATWMSAEAFFSEERVAYKNILDLLKKVANTQ